jgi:hypothetical protein
VHETLQSTETEQRTVVGRRAVTTFQRGQGTLWIGQRAVQILQQLAPLSRLAAVLLGRRSAALCRGHHGSACPVRAWAEFSFLVAASRLVSSFFGRSSFAAASVRFGCVRLRTAFAFRMGCDRKSGPGIALAPCANKVLPEVRHSGLIADNRVLFETELHIWRPPSDRVIGPSFSARLLADPLDRRRN